MFDASERTSPVAPVRAWVCLAAMVAVAGCTRGGPAEEEKSDPGPAAVTPIVVFGVDGLEWEVILEMLGAERLPNLAALIAAAGAVGETVVIQTVPTAGSLGDPGSKAMTLHITVGGQGGSVARRS